MIGGRAEAAAGEAAARGGSGIATVFATEATLIVSAVCQIGQFTY
jgi:hypothetical protein